MIIKTTGCNRRYGTEQHHIVKDSQRGTRLISRRTTTTERLGPPDIREAPGCAARPLIPIYRGQHGWPDTDLNHLQLTHQATSCRQVDCESKGFTV